MRKNFIDQLIYNLFNDTFLFREHIVYLQLSMRVEYETIEYYKILNIDSKVN